MSSAFAIACVGKPSAGKSSFLNAATDAGAKVGSYPFTTIRPNEGIAYHRVNCPCNGSSACRPRHGWCKDGRRFVPVRLLDIAGLVPGASDGRGLGNQFLDDLRHADVLIHIVDASGTTDAEGKATRGYDPIDDIRWLREEVEQWVLGNLAGRWQGIVRRHVATKAQPIETLHAQLAGYSTSRETVQGALDRLPRGFAALDKWGLDELRRFVDVFLDERFPTVVALNKIDMPDSDKNISSIMKRYSTEKDNVVLTSALGECFLRKMHKQALIEYEPGSDDFAVRDTAVVDDKTRNRLDNIRDLVLFRYGSTGVQDAIARAVDVLGFIPVYPVKSFATDSVYKDCVLVRPGTTVGEFGQKLHLLSSNRSYAGAETKGGIQLAESDVIVAGRNNIVRYCLTQ
ncbi:hypothetical protein GGI21_003148 [Coemansia aciculifera]|nr:hypothetical protein GGI21_003148 [Coemansia aciculifera]